MVIIAINDESTKPCAEQLSPDINRYFFPWEPTEYGEGYRDLLIAYNIYYVNKLLMEFFSYTYCGVNMSASSSGNPYTNANADSVTERDGNV